MSYEQTSLMRFETWPDIRLRGSGDYSSTLNHYKMWPNQYVDSTIHNSISTAKKAPKEADTGGQAGTEANTICPLTFESPIDPHETQDHANGARQINNQNSTVGNSGSHQCIRCIQQQKKKMPCGPLETWWAGSSPEIAAKSAGPSASESEIGGG